MTLTQVIRTCIEECLSVKLTPEWNLGPSNTVDFFVRSSMHGNIRVEVERRREDPVNNVAKAWRQACETGEEESFTLLHVFAGFHSSRSTTKRAKFNNARFVGERMQKWAQENHRGITYRAICIDFEPPKGNADPVLSDIDAKQVRKQAYHQLQVNP